MNTKPIAFHLSPTSTTISSAAYLLSLLRHCANIPLIILSSSFPTRDYSSYNFAPQKNMYTITEGEKHNSTESKQKCQTQKETRNRGRTRKGIPNGEKNKEEEDRIS